MLDTKRDFKIITIQLIHGCANVFVDSQFLENPEKVLLMDIEKISPCNCGEHIQFDKNFIRGHSNSTNHPLKGKKNFALSERNRKNSGEKHPFYGKKRPDISAKFSGENAPFYGKQHTPEAIEKNRQSHLGKKCPWASENMKRLWKERPEEMSNTTWKDTKPELTFEMLLQSVNFQYKKQYKVGKKRPDFYLPDFNLLVEIDGCWAHGCKEHRPDSQKEDKFEDKQRYYTARGFYSIRIWEHDLVI